MPSKKPSKSSKKASKKASSKSAGRRSAKGGGGASKYDTRSTASVENGGGETTADADPPIIISGGSVSISSRVPLTSRISGGRYIYETTTVKIGRINTAGKANQNNESNSGHFTITLFDE